MRFDCRHLRRMGPQLDSFAGRGQRPDAGNRSSHPNRRFGLPGPPIQNHRHGRRGLDDSHRRLSRPAQRRRLCAGRGSLRCLRLHRYERIGARQCAHRASCHPRHWPGAGCGLSRRRDHRHAGGRPGPFGRDRLLRLPHIRRHSSGRQSLCQPAQPLNWFCLRFLADFHFCPAGRWHFHQGR